MLSSMRGGFLSGGGTIVGDVTINGNLSMASGKQIFADAGTVAAPGIAWTTDAGSGVYLGAANNVRVGVGGVMGTTWSTGSVTLNKNIVVNTGFNLAMNGQFLADPGTLAAPGIAFNGDTNTGFYRVGADDLAASQGGVKVEI